MNTLVVCGLTNAVIASGIFLLVKTLGFISSPSLPATASGIDAKGNIQSRLTMIMRPTINFRISQRVGVSVCLLALVLLPLAPALTRAQQGAANVLDHSQPPASALDAAAGPEMASEPETASDKFKPAGAKSTA